MEIQTRYSANVIRSVHYPFTAPIITPFSKEKRKELYAAHEAYLRSEAFCSGNLHPAYIVRDAPAYEKIDINLTSARYGQLNAMGAFDALI